MIPCHHTRPFFTRGAVPALILTLILTAWTACAVAAPNLVVESFTPDELIRLADNTIEVVVRNTGDAMAGESYVRFFFLPDGAVYNRLTPAIPAGGAVTVDIQMNTMHPDPGVHDVSICADANDAVAESNEDDNCLAGVMTCRPTNMYFPDPLALFPDLQSAIDIMAPGGTLRILGGTYSGPGNRDLDFGGKDLSIVRADTFPVVIDCGGNPDEPHRGFRFTSGESSASLVEGLTIVNGDAGTGAGGGILVGNAEPVIRDCLIYDCRAQKGGAIAFSPATRLNPLVEGCTLAGNGADFGGAIFLAGNADPVVTHTIIAGNFSYDGVVVCDGTLGTPAVTITCSDIWNNSGGDWTGCIAHLAGLDGNLETDPLFCNPPGGDYTLADNSPCAAAVNGECGRIGALDVGCGPKGGSGATLIYVDSYGGGDYGTIQQAIDIAEDDDVIILADGTYTGAGNRELDPLGKRIVIRSASGDPLACRLNGEGAYRLLDVDRGEGPQTAFSGIGLFNGAADEGGAVRCDGSSPTFYGMYIADNVATGRGGGVYLDNGSSPVIRNCVFENNMSGDDGGGLFAATNSSPYVWYTRFEGNLATDRGGGACFAVNCFPEIIECDFVGNEAVNGGGLTFVYAYGPVIGSVFHDNTATCGGGYHGYGNARCDFTACTFVGNTAPDGANVYLRNNSDPTFERCLIVDGVNGSGLFALDAESSATLACSDVWGNAGGDWTAFIAAQFGAAGNLSVDPEFCDAAFDDFALSATSPLTANWNPECGPVGARAVGCGVASAPGTPPVRARGPRLEPNVPNPFNPATEIRYVLDEDGRVDLAVFDLAGRRVAKLVSGERRAGSHRVVWRARDDRGRALPSGIYFVRLAAGDATRVQKIMLMK